jgi:hypothetical protein
MLRVLEAHYCPLLYDPAFLLDRQKVGSDGLVRFGLPLLDLLGHYSIAFARRVFQPRPAFYFYRSALVEYEHCDSCSYFLTRRRRRFGSETLKPCPVSETAQDTMLVVRYSSETL